MFDTISYYMYFNYKTIIPVYIYNVAIPQPSSHIDHAKLHAGMHNSDNNRVYFSVFLCF